MVEQKIWKTPTCTLPDPADRTGYNVENCDVGTHAYDDALTEGECSVSCAGGTLVEHSYQKQRVVRQVKSLC